MEETWKFSALHKYMEELSFHKRFKYDEMLLGDFFNAPLEEYVKTH